MRLDTTSPLGAAWAIDHGFSVYEDDPGASDLIDLCEDCVLNERLIHGEADAEHPSYEDDLYTCANCGVTLTTDDD